MLDKILTRVTDPTCLTFRAALNVLEFSKMKSQGACKEFAQHFANSTVETYNSSVAIQRSVLDELTQGRGRRWFAKLASGIVLVCC